MIYSFPIRLDNSMTINTNPSTPLQFPITGGYDGDNVRMTNIVGYENGDFLKWCPHCDEVLPSESFGLRPTMDRDQSWCKDCR